MGVIQTQLAFNLKATLYSKNRKKEMAEEKPLLQPEATTEVSDGVTDKAPDANPPLVVAAIGVTGHGKSTFLNFVSQEKVFKTSKGLQRMKSCTKEISLHSVQFEDKRIDLIDTPGVFDTENLRKFSTEEKHYCVAKTREGILLIHNLLAACKEGHIDTVLLVYNPLSRWSLEMMELTKMLDQMRFPWDKTILVVNHAAEVFDICTEEERYKEWNSHLGGGDCPEDLREVCQRVSDRVVLVESKSNDSFHLTAVQEMLMKHATEIQELSWPIDKEAVDQMLKEFVANIPEEIRNMPRDEYIKIISIVCKDDYNALQEQGGRVISVRGELIVKLRQIASSLDTVNKKVFVAKVTGSSVSLVGGVISLVGIALAPVSFGATLGLTVVGGVVMLGGAVTNIVPQIVQWVDKNKTVRDIKEDKLLEKDRVQIKKFFTLYERIRVVIDHTAPEGTAPDFAFAAIATYGAGDIISTTRAVGGAVTIATSIATADMLLQVRNGVQVGVAVADVAAIALLPVAAVFSLIAMGLDITSIVVNSVSFSRRDGRSKVGDAIRDAVKTLEQEQEAIANICKIDLGNCKVSQTEDSGATSLEYVARTEGPLDIALNHIQPSPLGPAAEPDEPRTCDNKEKWSGKCGWKELSNEKNN